MKKVACYARFSSNNQRVESIEMQLETIKKYCANNNFVLVKTFVDEAKTATNDNRENFLKMIEESKNKQWEGIVLYSLDRFSRNVANHYYYKSILDEYNIKLYSVVDGFNGLDTAESGLMENIKVGLAQYYSMHLSTLILDSCIMTTKKGLSAGGTANLGFDIINQKYYINEDEANIVKKIFDLADKNNSLKQITNLLNKEKLTTKQGNKFSVQTVQRILRNKKYDGCMVYNVYKRKPRITAKKFKRVLKPKEEHVIVEDALPRIIEHEQFLRVQNNLDMYKRNNMRGGKNIKYLLSGLVICGECGSKMHVNRFSVGTKESQRIIYRCSNKLGGCVQLSERQLNNYILSCLNNLFGQTKENLKNKIIAKIKNIIEELDEKASLSLNYIESEKKEIDKLSIIAQQTNGMAKDALLKAIEEKLNNIVEKQIIVKEIEFKKAELNEVSLERVIAFSDEFKKEMLEDNFINKKALINKVINKITIKKDIVELEVTLSNLLLDKKADISFVTEIERRKIALGKFDENDCKMI